MDIKISVKNSSINGDLDILNSAKLRDMDLNTEVQIDDINLKGNVSILEKLEIDSVVNDLKNQIRKMDRTSSEYKDLKHILEDTSSDKKILLRQLGKHLGTFSQGVLASIVANYLTQL